MWGSLNRRSGPNHKTLFPSDFSSSKRARPIDSIRRSSGRFRTYLFLSEANKYSQLVEGLAMAVLLGLKSLPTPPNWQRSFALIGVYDWVYYIFIWLHILFYLI